MAKKIGFRNNTAGVLSRELAAPPDGSVLHMSAEQGGYFVPPDGRDYVVATLGDPQTPAAFEIVHLSAPEFLSGSDEYAFQVERNQEATARVAPWPAGTPIQALLTAGGLHALQEQAPQPGQSAPAFQVGDIKTTMVAPGGSDWHLADGSTHSASGMPALAAALGISDGPPSAIAAVRTAADYWVGGDKQRGALTSPCGRYQVMLAQTQLPDDSSTFFSLYKLDASGVPVRIPPSAGAFGTGDTGAFFCGAWLPDSSGFYLGRGSGEIYFYELDTATDTLTWAPYGDDGYGGGYGYTPDMATAIYGMAISEDGTLLAVNAAENNAGQKILAVNRNTYTPLTYHQGSTDAFRYRASEGYGVVYVGGNTFWFCSSDVQQAVVRAGKTDFDYFDPGYVREDWLISQVSNISVNKALSKAVLSTADGLRVVDLAVSRDLMSMAVPTLLAASPNPYGSPAAACLTKDEAYAVMVSFDAPYVKVVKLSDGSIAAASIAGVNTYVRRADCLLDGKILLNQSGVSGAWQYKVIEGAPGQVVLPNIAGTGSAKSYVKVA
ncbi:hypothetical protein [Comamonas aquatica]|uniref:Uncharacterized protein n=2 Tax=Comamonas aquatica TaxID=225991 RepID=A0AA35D650_9BURK|nr:hypothetical protein [Comamonas aquatica]CAB5675225.1 Uncharacterised protein [Comamonas aquatica]CAC9685864.1 Uncharacterised protein [Comamonas aquatica]